MSQETISLPTDCFHDKWLPYYWLTGIFWRVYCLLSSVTEPLLIQDTNPLLIIIANEPCLEGLADASTWWKICSHSMTVGVSVREKLDMDSLKNARTMILVILFIFTFKKNDKDVKMTGFHSEVFPVHPLGLFQVANVENCFICLYPYMKSAVNRKHFSLRKSAKGQYSILESIVITK